MRASRLRYLYAAGVVAATTAVARLMFVRLDLSNLLMVYLLATVIVAALWGRGPSVVATVLGVVAFDFLFVPPYFTLAVADTRYVFTFLVMLVVGLTIGTLATLGRREAELSRQRERRTAQLYALSRELAQRRSTAEITAALVRHVLASVDGEAEVLTDADASPAGTFRFPLVAMDRPLGVLVLRPRDPRQLELPEQRRLVEALASQAAIAIERVQLAEAAQAASVEVEAERFRNVLLASISHDLRTPLATIIGSASTLREDDGQLDAARRRTLLDSLLDEAQRMHRLVGNLLDVTRFLSGTVRPQRAPVALDEAIGTVLGRLQGALGARRVNVAIAPDLPLVEADEVMLDQVLANLVENAIKHTPAGTPLELRAEVAADAVVATVRDHGPGLPRGEEARVFEKFHRGRHEGAQSGFGLGLTICKCIVEAHGGRIGARNAPGGGAEFSFTLPLRAA